MGEIIKRENYNLIKNLITLAIPAVIEYTLQSAANYADYIMVRGLGEGASAAIGVTNSVNGMIKGSLMALSIGIVSYVSIEYGKGITDKMKATVMQVIILAGTIGFLMLILTQIISPFLPVWMGAGNDIKAEASEYFAINNIGIIGSSFSIMLCAALRGTGNMKIPMYVNVGMNILNIILNFVFIFDTRYVYIISYKIMVYGAGLGVIGAALATAISHICGGLSVLLVVLSNRSLSPLREKFRIDWNMAAKILQVAFPALLCRLCANFGRVIFTSFVTAMGTTTLAAHTIAMTAESAFFMPASGVSSAVTTIAGNAKGENNITKLNNLVKISVTLIFILMSAFSVIMFLFARNIMSLFSTNETVINLGTKLFYIVAFNEPFLGIAIVMEGIFNGIGYTKQTFFITVTILWTVRVFGTWVSINILNMGVYGAWICMVLDNSIRAVFLMVFYGWEKRSLFLLLIRQSEE